VEQEKLLVLGYLWDITPTYYHIYLGTWQLVVFWLAFDLKALVMFLVSMMLSGVAQTPGEWQLVLVVRAVLESYSMVAIKESCPVEWHGFYYVGRIRSYYNTMCEKVV
jgi:hypothetical protein